MRLQPRLVVTADDFGLTRRVDDGILAAHREGLVRHTTLLTNYPEPAAAVERLRAAPELDVGIHLNATTGRPLLPADRVPSLLFDDGSFPGLARFLWRALRGGIRREELRREWAAQIERGLALGCAFSSVTSHQHVHMLPALARITGELAREYGIPFTRLTRFHRASFIRPLRLKAFALLPWALASRRALRKAGVRHNEFVIDVPVLPRTGAVTRFAETVAHLPPTIVEVVAHPGYVDEELHERDRLLEGRLHDLAVLTAPELRSLNGRVELTSYGALAAGA